MKKSTIIGLSILSVLLLLSMSFISSAQSSFSYENYSDIDNNSEFWLYGFQIGFIYNLTFFNGKLLFP